MVMRLKNAVDIFEYYFYIFFLQNMRTVMYCDI